MLDGNTGQHYKKTNSVQFQSSHTFEIYHEDPSLPASISVKPLLAVLCHLSLGRSPSLNSGHYISLVKNPRNGKWFRFDDVTVKEVQWKEVQAYSKEAYILFFGAGCLTTAQVEGQHFLHHFLFVFFYLGKRRETSTKG
jgi:ubiquitin C-terminal hydrolase